MAAWLTLLTTEETGTEVSKEVGVGIVVVCTGAEMDVVRLEITIPVSVEVCVPVIGRICAVPELTAVVITETFAVTEEVLIDSDAENPTTRADPLADGSSERPVESKWMGLVIFPIKLSLAIAEAVEAGVVTSESRTVTVVETKFVIVLVS